MLPDYSYSELTPTWEPAQCEGSLEVVEMQPQQPFGYLPGDEGTLTPINADLWRYDASDEPMGALCPETVSVWIAAMQGDEELTRISILVQPVHTWWTYGHKHGPNAQQHPPDTSDFANDYVFLNLKYGSVLATTGGAFTGGVEISTDVLVRCPWWNPWAPLVAACTYGSDDSVIFATAAFTGSENAATSIVGHELVHTTGISPALASDC